MVQSFIKHLTTNDLVIQYNIHSTGFNKMTMQIYEKFRNERKNTTNPEVLQKRGKAVKIVPLKTFPNR